jgi:calcineurin-like phosphoesterase family protein
LALNDLTPPGPPKISIAVISDLHVGVSARALDLNPRPETSKYAEKSYIETFERFIADHDLRSAFLVVPGDITNRAAPDEFRLASKQIMRIAAALRVPNDRVLFVPGNHDVDWTVLSLDPGDTTDFRRRQCYQPLVQPECMFADILGRATVNKIVESECFCIWTYSDLLVIGLNSAFHDGPDENVHHGLVPAHALRQLDNALHTIAQDHCQLRLAIVHHHPVQYSDPVPDEPDFSTMTNAEALLELLEQQNFDLVIHGHKHVPNFNVWQISSYFQLPILGAGSFSYLLDPRWNGLVNNQFHILDIHGRDASTGRLLGVLKNFTYLCGHGWQESRPNNGIEHEIYFGGLHSEPKLESELRSAVTAGFQAASYVRLRTLLANRPDFRYVASKLLMKVLRKLGTELGFAIHDGDMSNVLLLKE